MGIKKISKLINDIIKDNIAKNVKFANPIIEKNIKDYRGKWIVFDANLVLYKIIIAIRGSNNGDILNDRGKSISHLHALFFKVINLINNEIKPIFVFDGEPPKLKEEILEDRKKAKEKAYKLLEELDDENSEEKKKLIKRTFTLKRSQVEECMMLLNLMGIPHIQAIKEADPQCVGFTLSQKYNIYGVASEDNDLLVFGSKYLLKDFSNTKKIREYNLHNIIKLLKLKNHSQYVDLCILLGSDYCKQTIKGLSAEKILELLIKYKDMEGVIKYASNNSKYVIPEGYLNRVKEARNEFINPIIYNIEEIDIKIRKPDTRKLLQFMLTENGFVERNQLNININKLRDKYKASIQKL